VEAEWRRKGKSGDATPLPSQVGVKWPSTEVWFGKIIVSFATGGYIIVFELDFIYSAHSQVENSFHTLPPCVFTHPITLSNDATLLPDSISTTMSEITTSEVMYGTAGVVNGKLQLSQGITRDLSHGGIGGQFTEIPVIDLSPMTNPSSSPVDKTKLVADIRAACSRVGFFVIKNHGIEWKIVDDAFDGLKEFFDLPMEKKMEVHQSMSDSYQGMSSFIIPKSRICSQTQAHRRGIPSGLSEADETACASCCHRDW
jgi:hypothetical protein